VIGGPPATVRRCDGRVSLAGRKVPIIRVELFALTPCEFIWLPSKTSGHMLFFSIAPTNTNSGSPFPGQLVFSPNHTEPQSITFRCLPKTYIPIWSCFSVGPSGKAVPISVTTSSSGLRSFLSFFNQMDNRFSQLPAFSAAPVHQPSLVATIGFKIQKKNLYFPCETCCYERCFYHNHNSHQCHPN
jgi:hypothetical protein